MTRHLPPGLLDYAAMTAHIRLVLLFASDRTSSAVVLTVAQFHALAAHYWPLETCCLDHKEWVIMKCLTIIAGGGEGSL